MKNLFTDLGLADFLLDKIKQVQINTPTKVQKEAIPFVLAGQDLIARSPTGSGKTLAYLLPLLSKIDVKQKNLQVLILAPTRELAMQIQIVIKQFAPEGLFSLPLIGGANISRQLENLKKKPQIAVATPGRIVELLEKNKLNLQNIKSVVIDEADKMFGDIYLQALDKMLKHMPKTRQVLLFSATIPEIAINKFIHFLREPQTVNIEEGSRTAVTIKHVYFLSSEKEKAMKLRKILAIYQPQKAIIFVNHNEGVASWNKHLQEVNLTSEGLHGGLSELARKNVLNGFREGKFRFLITTDMFARGMDVYGVDFVFNFDLPESCDHYLHRVGRTGRAGNKGIAVSLVTEKQKFIMKKYARMLHAEITECGISNGQIIEIKKPLKH